MQRQAMHPQRTGYMPSLLPPGTGYPDFTPMGETDEYPSWQMQQMQQQQIQRQMQEQHQAFGQMTRQAMLTGQREPVRAQGLIMGAPNAKSGIRPGKALLLPTFFNGFGS